MAYLRCNRLEIGFVVAIAAVGAAFRIGEFGQALYGDELWSYAVSRSGSVGAVIDFVQSDQEISPPLFALLAWLAAKLGNADVWIRLPSLIAGILVIPLTFSLGLLTVGKRAAFVAASMAALSPFLAFYSVEARAYSIAVALSAASTMAMLIAIRGGARRWWVAYGAFSCAAMYSHYTVAFVLLAQLLWLLWRRPAARIPALVANAGAALAYLPWMTSLIDDVNSPSQDIIGSLAPFSFANFTRFTGATLFGSPGDGLNRFLGTPLEIALFAGLAIGLAGAVVAMTQGTTRAASDEGRDGEQRGTLMLPVLLALACPVGAGLVSLLAADQFLPRNLAASWPGFAVALAAVLTMGPRVYWVPATTFVLGVFATGAVLMTEPQWSRPDIGAAARYIEAETGPNVVVIDTLSLGGDGLPLGETLSLEMTEPFQRYPPAALADAVAAAAGGRMAIVGPPVLAEGFAQAPELAGLEPVESRTFPGALDTEVFIFEIPARRRG